MTLKRFKKKHLKELINGIPSSQDTYFATSEGLMLYSPKGHVWSKQELSHLEQSGFTEIVEPIDENEPAPLSSGLIDKLSSIRVHDSTPRDKLVSIFWDLGNIWVDIEKDGLTKRYFELLHCYLNLGISCLKQDPYSFIPLIYHCHNYRTLGYHSARVGIISAAIALQAGCPPKSVEDIGMGGLLHDIGELKLGPELRDIHRRYTVTDMKKAQTHPVEGWNTVRAYTKSLVTLDIICHHHERLNGSGYPIGHNQHEILPETQLVGLIDCFDAIMAKSDDHAIFDVLSYIRNSIAGSLIDHQLFELFVNALVESHEAFRPSSHKQP